MTFAEWLDTADLDDLDGWAAKLVVSHAQDAYDAGFAAGLEAARLFAPQVARHENGTELYI